MMKRNIKLFLLAILVILSVVSLMGCSGTKKAEKTPETNPVPKVAPQPQSQPEMVKLTLFFGDKNAEFLQPEQRQVSEDGKTLPELLLQELIKGPQLEGLNQTIPQGTKLLSLEIKQGVAKVNLSQDAQTKHWGGTAGEMMTVYSIVNTLTQVPEISKVQFLLEGQKLESIWGHLDTTEPIGPDPTLNKS